MQDEGGKVKLRICNSAGRAVRALIDGVVEPGYHVISWDGKDRFGNFVTGGLYFCTLETPKQRFTKKIIVLH